MGPILFLMYVNEMSAQTTYGKLLQFSSGITQAIVQQNMLSDLSQLAV